MYYWGGGGEIEPPPEEGFVKAKLTIQYSGLSVRDPFGSTYLGFSNGRYGKLSPQLYEWLMVAMAASAYIFADGPFYYNGIKYQGNETDDSFGDSPVMTLWNEWYPLRGQTVDVWLKSGI